MRILLSICDSAQQCDCGSKALLSVANVMNRDAGENSSELKPCPFCGSAARWATTDGADDSWEIQCSNNDCCIVLFAGATGKETRNSWNTRALASAGLREGR